MLCHPSFQFALCASCLSFAMTAAAHSPQDVALTERSPAATARETASEERPPLPSDAVAKETPPLSKEEKSLVDSMTELFLKSDKASGIQDSIPPSGAPDDADTAQNPFLAEDINLLTSRYSETQRRTRLNAFAGAFYRVLPQRNLELLKLLCAYPFRFEDRLVETEQAFEDEWKRAFSNLRLGAQPLKRMQVFSAAEMTQYFGERPAKLADWPVTEDSYFSVGEFGVQTIIILWRLNGEMFVAQAIHG